jgi:hypothetical protein
MGLFNIFKQKKQTDSEKMRREFLLVHGRITEGTIVDSETTESGEEIAFYVYNVQGVDFESSEMLTAEQRKNPLQYAPGAKIGVRFDPKNHGNCMLV